MRLFFGLSLPEEIRAVTADCADKAQSIIPGRYSLVQNHHITLAFLGEVSPERMGDVQRVLEGCTSFPAPWLTLEGFSYFGRPQNGILILRVKSEPALEPLHEVLISALQEEGLPADEGHFSPHITLARHACIGKQWPSCPEVSFQAQAVHVFLSARDEQNVLRYTPVYSVPFLR